MTKVKLYNYAKKKQKPKFITILGSTGDLGSQLANYLIKKGLLIQLVVRKGSLEKLKLKVALTPKTRILETESLFDKSLVKEIINSSRIIFNFAGMVSLSFSEKVFPNILLINSLFPDFLNKFNQSSQVPIVYASTQRMETIAGKKNIELWLSKIIKKVDSYSSGNLNNNNFERDALILIKNFIYKNSIPSNVNIYELSKALAERILERNNNSTILRVSSCYGPGCSNRRTIGRLIFSRLSGTMITEKEEIRDYIYIEDINNIFNKLINLKTTKSHI